MNTDEMANGVLWCRPSADDFRASVSALTIPSWGYIQKVCFVLTQIYSPFSLPVVHR